MRTYFSEGNLAYRMKVKDYFMLETTRIVEESRKRMVGWSEAFEAIERDIKDFDERIARLTAIAEDLHSQMQRLVILVEQDSDDVDE